MIKFSNRVRCAVACFAVDWWKQHPLFKAGYDSGLHDAELEADSEEAYEQGKKDARRDKNLSP